MRLFVETSVISFWFDTHLRNREKKRAARRFLLLCAKKTHESYVSLIVLLVIPRKAVQKHIRTLAGIARLLQYEETRDALSGARSPREALQLIREEEQKDPA